MKTLLLNVPSFSGKIVSPTWIKAVRDFQSKSKAERDSYCSACGCTGGCNLCDDISKYRISVLLKDRKKKVVSIFYTILIMVVCKVVIL